MLHPLLKIYVLEICLVDSLLATHISQCTYRHSSTIPTTPGSLFPSESLPPPPSPHIPVGEGQAQIDFNVNSYLYIQLENI